MHDKDNTYFTPTASHRMRCPVKIKVRGRPMTDDLRCGANYSSELSVQSHANCSDRKP